MGSGGARRGGGKKVGMEGRGGERARQERSAGLSVSITEMSEAIL